MALNINVISKTTLGARESLFGNLEKTAMALNSSKREEVESRRAFLAQRRIVFRDTQRELAERFKVSVGTINNDLKVLNERWKQQAALDTASLKAGQLAELDQVKRMLWMRGFEPSAARSLVQVLKLEAQLTGTLAPPVYNFNISILMQLAKAIQDSGMEPSEAFEAFKQMFAQKQEEEIAHDRHEKGDHHQAGQALLDDHANDRH